MSQRRRVHLLVAASAAAIAAAAAPSPTLTLNRSGRAHGGARIHRGVQGSQRGSQRRVIRAICRANRGNGRSAAWRRRDDSSAERLDKCSRISQPARGFASQLELRAWHRLRRGRSSKGRPVGGGGSGGARRGLVGRPVTVPRTRERRGRGGEAEPAQLSLLCHELFEPATLATLPNLFWGGKRGGSRVGSW